MKTNKIVSLFAVVLSLAALIGCGTPQQTAAATVYSGSMAYAEHVLDGNPALLPVIQDVAAKLPKLNTGELTPFDLGQLSGELTQLRTKVVDLESLDPANRDKYATFDAFLGGVITSDASLNGGNVPTVNTAIKNAVLQQASSGLRDGVLHWQGRQSIIHPK